MMSKLPLAVDIADAAAKADELHEPIDLKTEADQLKNDHPEADATREEIAAALQEISKDADLYDALNDDDGA